MTRIGMMIRSAKMNEMTPPKLIPPFQSTAASGTLPIEQTKLSTATSGPTSGPHRVASRWWPSRNSPCPGQQQAAEDVSVDGRPVHDEVLAGAGEAGRTAQALPDAALPVDGHVHGGVALHRAGQPLVGLLTGGVDDAAAHPQPKGQ